MGAVTKTGELAIATLNISAPPGNYQGEPIKKVWQAFRKYRSPKNYRAHMRQAISAPITDFPGYLAIHSAEN